MKKIIVVVLLCLCFTLTGCGNRDNQLIMATEAGFAPYEFYEGSQIVGVDVEIAKKIAERLGKELVVKDVAFDSIINEVNSGKADFGAAGMSITPEKQKQVDFTIEYAISNQVIVVKKDNNTIKESADLHGKTVAVQLGTTADLYFDNEQNGYSDVKVITEKKFLAAAEDVKAGKADAIVMDQLPAQELVKQNSDLIILNNVLFTDSYGMIVKKGNKELLNVMNEVLKELINEGKITEYTMKYSK